MQSILLIAAAFWVCAGTAAGQAEKILFADSFETEIIQGRPTISSNPQAFQNPASKWAIYSCQVYSWDDKIFHDGKHSVRLGQTVGHAMLTLDPLAVQENDYIQSDIWTRTENSAGQTYIAMEFYANDKSVGSEIKGGSPQGPIIYMPASLAGTNDWTLMTVRSRVPLGATHVSVKLVALNNNTGSVWFDDFVVRQLGRDWGDGQLDRHPVRLDPTALKADDYVSIKNEHLSYKGERLRIWSAKTDLYLADTHRDIDREVDRFIGHGFNAIRTLEWGWEVTDKYIQGDNSSQDGLDYVIASLGQKGRFVWMDILNACFISPDLADVINDPCTASQWTAAIKEYLGKSEHENIRTAIWGVWDSRTKEIYHNYIKRVMAHRNKYNGLTYGEDPAIFCWELTNEQWWIMRILWGNHLSLPEYLQKGLYDQWNAWLKKKYLTHEQLVKAWGQTIEGESLEKGSILLLPLLGDTNPSAMAQTLGLQVKFKKIQYGPSDLPAERGRDVLKFLNEIVITAKQEAAAILKNQGRKGLGCQVVPVVYDTGYSGNIHSFYMQSFADAITCLVYLDMRAWSSDEPTFPFASGLKKPPLIHDLIDNRRIAGKPTFVYENMIFEPQKYRAEYSYRLLCWAATQDADVINFHDYGHKAWLGDAKNRYTMNPLQHVIPSSEWNGTMMRTDEVLMSTVQIAGEIFKRGYLKAAPNPTTITIGNETLWNMAEMNSSHFEEAARRTAFSRGFQWQFNPLQDKDTVDGPLVMMDDPKGIVNPTNQISYRWKDGLLVIDDPHAKVLAGFVPKDFCFTDGLKLENICVNTPQGMPFVIKGEQYGTFGIVSQDGKPLGKSLSILVSMANTSFNKGFEMDLKKMAEDKAYVYGLARSITNQGDMPVLVGRMGLVMKAPWLKGRLYRMLDYNGNVLNKGKCKADVLTIHSDLPIYRVEITK